MAVKKFILKQEHINIIKHLKFSLTDTLHLISIENHENNHDEQGYTPNLLGGNGIDDLYEQIGIILFGKPQNLDIIKAGELYQYSQEQKDSMIQLIKELPIALEIVLSRQSFNVGNFKMKTHEGEWKLIG